MSGGSKRAIAAEPRRGRGVDSVQPPSPAPTAVLLLGDPVLVSRRLAEIQAATVGAEPMFGAYEVLYGDTPPFLSDFWNNDVATDISQPAVRKVVRIRGEEFVVPR